MKPEDFTIGWISALPLELAAARGMLDTEHTDLHYNEGSNQYILGRIGHHNVVLTCLPMGRYGTIAAAVVAKEMQHTFPSVKIGLMVGIGGGVPKLPENDIRLGDVVVGRPTDTHGGVIQHDLGKATRDGGFRRVGALNGASTFLLNALAGLEAKHIQKGQKGHELLKHVSEMIEKNPTMRDQYEYQGTQDDRLFKASYPHGVGSTCAECDTSQLVHRGPARKIPEIHFGLIASGNQVIKDAETRDRLRGRVSDDGDGEILCFEMEAAGLLNDFPCLVIRGICDYADSHKNKEWQHRAAATAAAYAKELICFMACGQAVNSRTTQEMSPPKGKLSSLLLILSAQVAVL
jgi:nucleoside phosphorylase